MKKFYKAQYILIYQRTTDPSTSSPREFVRVQDPENLQLESKFAPTCPRA
jgi:hypothetical protein